MFFKIYKQLFFKNLYKKYSVLNFLHKKSTFFVWACQNMFVCLRFVLYIRPKNKLINSNLMLIIDVKDGEGIDKALRRYKKKFEKAGTLKEIRRRKNFVKPSILRRAEVQKAAYRTIILSEMEK
jgi:small subunit ribosomal protein S21